MYPTINQNSGGGGTASPSGLSFSAYPSLGQVNSAPRPAGGSFTTNGPTGAASSRPLAAAPGSPQAASNLPLLRVHLAEQYRLPPAVPVSASVDDIPKSQFTFDFALERRLVEEQDRAHSSTGAAPLGEVDDPLEVALAQYGGEGYERAELALALAALGPAAAAAGPGAKERLAAWVASYRQLASMGFAPAAVAGALALTGGDLAAATDACLAEAAS